MLGHEADAACSSTGRLLGFDGHVAGRIDDPSWSNVISIPVSTGISVSVSRQGGDDAERLMCLERPQIEGPAIVRGEREVVDRTRCERLIGVMNRPSVDVGVTGSDRRARSAAGVESGLARRKLSGETNDPGGLVLCVSSATSVEQWPQGGRQRDPVGTSASGADAEAVGRGDGPTPAASLRGSSANQHAADEVTMTAAIPTIARGTR
jgi:hypothetical protein